MKKLILTIDYELFFGNRSGSVKECMIEPTLQLESLLEINNSRMTVFWDVLHYYRLLELENKYPELKMDRILIKEQIINLVKKGHDIQLHLHPHWLDTKYENHKWVFNYDRFSLDSLSAKKDPDDINTILGCITLSRKLLEEVIREEKKDYKVKAFRAGGYLIEPFDKIKDSLLKNEIFIDSSVSPGTRYNHERFSYDFKNYPRQISYKYDSTPRDSSDFGIFTEIPVTAIKMPLFFNIYYKLMRKKKYPNLDNERGGEGTYHSFYKKSFLKRAADLIFTQDNLMFSTDTNFEERFNYMLKKVPESGTMILHPKLLNKHTLNLLCSNLTTNKIKFISIMQFLNYN